ncbi:penicillin-binding transpeptidase domain-containing protein [Microbispora amethystogenes]|uniref:penicillin-binding transpeptidase domain-containing protein n=1 Tax=Microbispora amethystogenes TaxID=1427754 RepID=UPI001954816B|nr:penicillin-binding transpeptidase domain-containing protein [Microbispora amethystogenes]
MRERRRWPYVTAGVLVPVVAAGATIWALRTKGSPEETARDFLAAWSRSDYVAMRALTADPPSAFDSTYRRFHDDLKLTGQRFQVRDVQEETVRFRARLTGPLPVAYDGRLRLVERDRAWKVAWTPAAVHPRLTGGVRATLTTVPAERAPTTAADGTRIDTPDAPGSVRQLVEALREQYGSRLDGTASARADLVDTRTGAKVVTLAEGGAKPGEPLRTTLDLRVHRAGARALEDVDKPASLVALRPSTGEVLAVVNKPGGYNRALLGAYPPGSTFKVVTASALVAGGVTPGQTVECPAEKTIGGFPFHNSRDENGRFHDYGALPFVDAFAHSCNTTFGEMSVRRLGADRLAKVAADFGFGASIKIGVPAVDAAFPAPRDDTDLASAAIGQGRVLASPLNMAAVAGAVAAGTWRQPRLVPAALVPDGGTPPRPLEPAVVSALRRLMPAVVSEGTASGVSFPAGTAGKTGTAEYGSGTNPPTHSWFIGYKGDLAFAVVVEGGGTGAQVAAPAAARFLKAL